MNLRWWVYFKFQKKAQEDGSFLPEFADAEEGKLLWFGVLLGEKSFDYTEVALIELVGDLQKNFMNF